MIKLPLAELKVMNIIWNSDKDSLSSKDIIEQLSEKETWKRTTILTLLSRLINKGYLSGRKIGRHTFYTQIIKKEDYADFATKEFMNTIHGNSLESLFVSLKNIGNIDSSNFKNLKNNFNNFN